MLMDMTFRLAGPYSVSPVLSCPMDIDSDFIEYGLILWNFRFYVKVYDTSLDLDILHVNRVDIVMSSECPPWTYLQW